MPNSTLVTLDEKILQLSKSSHEFLAMYLSNETIHLGVVTLIAKKKMRQSDLSFNFYLKFYLNVIVM